MIKNLNTSCILTAIREKGRISRAEIARQTGLTPATVSNITAELIEYGLIAETDRGTSNGGRKPVLLSICPKICYFAGVHIGSNRLEVAVADVDAEVMWNEQVPIAKGSRHTEILQQVIGLVNKALSEIHVPLSGIGVCVHGLVRSEEGLLVFAPNLGWENVHIGDMLENEFKVPVIVENDVRAMTLGESWCGFARSVRDYIYLFIGPGIGGSIVFDSELYKGYGGFAGEFGHNTVEPDGPLCSCGNRGCLQALASETTMIANFLRREGRVEPEDGEFDFSTLVEAARGGNRAAVEEIQKSAQYIGIEVGNIINAFSPPLVVINGRITGLGSMVMTVIDEVVRSRGLKYSTNSTRIVFSRLGETAQIKGAAACAIRELFASPKKFLGRA